VRARYTVAGKVRIDLPDDARWQLRSGAQMSVIVNRQDFDELVKVVQAGDAEKAEQARALDEARAEIRRLTDDRDHWEQEAANWRDAANAPRRQELRETKQALEFLRREYEHVKGQRDVLLQAEELKPARVVLTVGDGEFSTFLPIGDGDALRQEVDELKATVVRQANEITALKGESE
jgi:hypothetical protein